MPHDFLTSLTYSKGYVNAPWWEEVYRKAFVGIKRIVAITEDGMAQRDGIDRVIWLNNDVLIYVDEKVREKDWPDFLLEYWSDKHKRIPGWIAKDLATDFIAYAFVPSKRCFLLPFPLLRTAWRNNRKQWIAKYKRIEADNSTWLTISVAVPIQVVLAAIGDVMLVRWAA